MQTAYANGSSTAYITNQLGVPVAFTPTGVKHLHHRAVQFPIGVYFEANGHGTVVFDEKTQALIRSKGGAKLNALMDVINQTVGDAISDMLLVECVLADRDWDCEQWFNCYKDLPNRLGKVAVRDRAMVTTTDAERKVVTPEKLQPGIDAIVAKFSQGRSFVRPRCAMKSWNIMSHYNFYSAAVLRTACACTVRPRPGRRQMPSTWKSATLLFSSVVRWNMAGTSLEPKGD